MVSLDKSLLNINFKCMQAENIYIFWFLSCRMIFTVLCGLLFGSDGYFVGLAWSSCALMFFIVSIMSLY